MRTNPKPNSRKPKMKRNLSYNALSLLMATAALLSSVSNVFAQDKKPNIVVMMGDDIGMWNIGAYHRGMMAGRTPNLDKIAKEGMLFTDYYAEASCTAGRANFIMGELPIRTGMTTVGQAGAKIGIPAEACTIATALKAQGYTTGQFGKNHLGDLNEFLPTVHGFDEFFGYLYHLDAMEDPAHPNYPQNLLNVVGPRNMVHSWATTTDDTTDLARWGKVGKQKIEDAGTLYPERMKTVDNEIRDFALSFIEKAQKDGKPFFCWLNPTRMHIVTHLSDKYEKMRNSENGWSEEEAGMAQLDVVIELSHACFFFGPAILRVAHLLILVRKMGDDVHAGWVKPAEERLVVRLGLLDERQGEVADLVIHSLHPFGIKCAGVLDLLFADFVPARHHGGVVRVGRPGMNHVARADLVQQILRIVRMRRVFHRVQVIEVPEELVEAVDGRQELIQIAQMVLAELTRGIALRFKRGGDRARLRRDADLGTGLADRRHPRANWKFAHDEVGATCCATRFRVVVGEQHSF